MLPKDVSIASSQASQILDDAARLLLISINERQIQVDIVSQHIICEKAKHWYSYFWSMFFKFRINILKFICPYCSSFTEFTRYSKFMISTRAS